VIDDNDLKEFTWRKIENTKRHGVAENYYGYHIIAVSEKDLAYGIAVCYADSGNAEWFLYVARICMNYLHEYFDGKITKITKSLYTEKCSGEL